MIILLSTPYQGWAEVIRLEIKSRQPVLGEKSYGSAGGYEIIRGQIFFEFDPGNKRNYKITDIQLAPVNERGKVEANGNIIILKPIDPTKSSGITLVEVSNRGGKFSPRYFNRAGNGELNPLDLQSFGDGLLMYLGVTVVWVGWQFDIPEENDRLRLNVPVARNKDGSSITGLVRSDWVIKETTQTLSIGHRQQIGYPVSVFDDPVNILTVRDEREGQRRIIPTTEWRFARLSEGEIIDDSLHIYMESGFEAGKIYELVYRSQDPPVVGLGLGVMRDVISYAKYHDSPIFSAKYGIAAGVSQTGRFLRLFLYQGFNEDEQGRKAYDGCMIITAGAGRGSFNHRFAQPSRDAHRFSAFFYPTDLFPFTGREVKDPETEISDGLLANINPDLLPKIFYINTGYEYWGRAASLIHIDPQGKKDVDPMDNERIYHLASGQHFVERFPPQISTKIGATSNYRGNHLDFSVNYRALLQKLIRWVSEDKSPPESAYPTIKKGNLVRIDELDLPPIPDLRKPSVIHLAYRVDYGPQWNQGIIDFQPPVMGEAFVPLVSQVDEYGNEIGGIRNVEIVVPLATYTPWNLRTGLPGNQMELTDFRGTFIPFPKNEIQKQNFSDSRPAVNQLYGSKSEYLQKVKSATESLIQQGFVLERDRGYLQDKAIRYWDWVMAQ
ncbi:MAG: alpha/beta hydrolase domain-containing protein [Bacteroidetes bacterium]|nr:alpha/beta hydrolase domain-containing protein [Bacteroidota bacterium]